MYKNFKYYENNWNYWWTILPAYEYFVWRHQVGFKCKLFVTSNQKAAYIQYWNFLFKKKQLFPIEHNKCVHTRVGTATNWDKVHRYNDDVRLLAFYNSVRKKIQKKKLIFLSWISMTLRYRVKVIWICIRNLHVTPKQLHNKFHVVIHYSFWKNKNLDVKRLIF